VNYEHPDDHEVWSESHTISQPAGDMQADCWTCVHYGKQPPFTIGGLKSMFFEHIFSEENDDDHRTSSEIRCSVASTGEVASQIGKAILVFMF
jgi:hypothetical protein